MKDFDMHMVSTSFMETSNLALFLVVWTAGYCCLFVLGDWLSVTAPGRLLAVVLSCKASLTQM